MSRGSMWRVGVAAAVLMCGRRAAPAQSNAPAAGGEVVVTATRTATALRNVPAFVEVIGTQDVARAAPVAVSELLKGRTGVDMQGGGFPGEDVSLHLRGLAPGFQTKRVLVLQDGRRVNEEYQGSAELALLPADGVERVELVRGPVSALYGSGAMGGVVSVRTRTGQDMVALAHPEGVAGDGPAFGTSVRLAGGNYDTWTTRILQGGVVGPVDYAVAGSYLDTHGYTTNANGSARDWTAANVNANLGMRTGPHSDIRLYAGGYGGHGTDDNSARDADKDFQQAVYNWLWSDRHDAQLTVRAYRNGYYNIYDWNYPGEGIYRQQTLGAEAQQSLWAGARNRITVGGEGRRESVDITEVQGPTKEDQSTAAAYAQDELHLGERVQLTAGVRDDDMGTYGSFVSPRLAVLWRALEATDLYASYGRAYRAPGLSDRFVNVEYNGARFEGNPNLDPEALTAYEVGARQRLCAQASLNVAGFYNKLEDSFDFVMDPDGVFRVRNVTELWTAGVEAELRVTVNQALSGYLNYAYTDSAYGPSDAYPNIDGHQAAYLAPHKAAAGIDVRHPWLGQHGVQCRYVDSRYSDPANTEATRMDAYVVVDWRSRVPVWKTWQVTLNVDNVFDANYRDFPTFPQPGTFVLAGVETVF